MSKYDAYTEYIDYPVHFERLKWLYETIDNRKNHKQKVKILDIGCGTGNVTIPLGLISNTEVYGIDIHQPTLNIAIKNNPFDNVSFKFEYLHECDISDFDYLILTEVLEHIDAYEDVIKYIAKNAKKGMNLLITIPNGYGPFEISQQPLYLMRKLGLNNFINKIKRLLGKQEPYSQNYETPHVNFFTISGKKRKLLKYNLVISEIKNAFAFAPIIETYFPFIPLKTIASIDNKFSQLLPHCLSSGWYFKINFKTADTNK